MPNPRGSFIWYELMTPDPKAAKAFYDAVVGWNIGVDSVAPGTEYRMIGRSDGGNAGGVLTLTDEMRDGGAIPRWTGYLHVPDIDATVAAIVADGGSQWMEPIDMPGVGRLAIVAGPEDAPIYVMNPLPPEGQPDAVSDVFSVDQPQHVRWNELWSRDPGRSVEFYQRHFGWEQRGEMDMGEMGKYQFFYVGDVRIGAVMPKMPEMPASMWNFYVGVDDIDRAAAAVKNGGGQIIHGPVEIPGGEYSIQVVDPHGVHVGFVGPRK